MLHFRWKNTFWLMIPLLLWNIFLGPRLVHPGFAYDQQAARWLLISENILRVAVFILPLLLPLNWESKRQKFGLGLYLLGTLIYFAAWLPLIYTPQSAWSNSLIGFTAPAFTPLIWLLGIALVGGWWPYALLSGTFVAVHGSHWTQVFLIYMQVLM